MPLLSLSVSQLLLAFVSASILHKLTWNRFFIKWLASHKFACFQVPSNIELRKLKDKDKDHGGRKGKHKNRSKHKNTYNSGGGDTKQLETFEIPTADLESLKLDKTILDFRDLELITYSVELEWIVDLTLMSIFSFTITEIQFYFYPQTKECNFSLLWALLVIIYCIKTLWKLTSFYFKIGDQSICIISGCTFLLIAMIILIVDENNLELGLESAYRSFNDSATAFVNNHSLLNNQSRPTTRPVSFILVKFSIAIICSLVGVVFTFPGLRFGQLHKGLVELNQTNRMAQLLYNFNYLSPLFIVCLWVKPVTRNLITNQSLLTLNDATFDTIRIYCIFVTSIIRFFLLPKFVAMYLTSTNSRLSRIKYRGGHTTNREIQLTVSSINNYVNVVTIQYILPIIMCLFTAIMLKSMGGHNWIPSIFDYSTSNDGISTDNTTIKTGMLDQTLNVDSFITIMRNISEPSPGYGESQNLTRIFSIASMVDFIEFKKIFSTSVFRGIFGFSTWWLHFSWFCTSTAGLLYHTYFIH